MIIVLDIAMMLEIKKKKNNSGKSLRRSFYLARKFRLLGTHCNSSKLQQHNYCFFVSLILSIAIRFQAICLEYVFFNWMTKSQIRKNMINTHNNFTPHTHTHNKRDEKESGRYQHAVFLCWENTFAMNCTETENRYHTTGERRAIVSNLLLLL